MKTVDNFAARLKAQRRRRGLRQRHVHERSGLQKEMISKWECGAGVSHTNLEKLSDALEVSSDYLLCRIAEPLSIGPITTKIRANLESMDTQLFRVITTYLHIDTQYYQREMIHSLIIKTLDSMPMVELEQLMRLSEVT